MIDPRIGGWDTMVRRIEPVVPLLPKVCKRSYLDMCYQDYVDMRPWSNVDNIITREIYETKVQRRKFLADWSEAEKIHEKMYSKMHSKTGPYMLREHPHVGFNYADADFAGMELKIAAQYANDIANKMSCGMDGALAIQKQMMDILCSDMKPHTLEQIKSECRVHRNSIDRKPLQIDRIGWANVQINHELSVPVRIGSLVSFFNGPALGEHRLYEFPPALKVIANGNHDSWFIYYRVWNQTRGMEDKPIYYTMTKPQTFDLQYPNVEIGFTLNLNYVKH